MGLSNSVTCQADGTGKDFPQVSQQQGHRKQFQFGTAEK